MSLDDVDFGTSEYMPPEFYRSGAYDCEGDWWALGCLLFEASTGAPPFTGLDLKRLSTKILCKCIPPKTLNIDTEPHYAEVKDQGLQELIRALLVKDPLLRMKESR